MIHEATSSLPLRRSAAVGRNLLIFRNTPLKRGGHPVASKSLKNKAPAVRSLAPPYPLCAALVGPAAQKVKSTESWATHGIFFLGSACGIVFHNDLNRDREEVSPIHRDRCVTPEAKTLPSRRPTPAPATNR